MNKDSFKVIFRTLKYKNYRLFFTGQSISLIGTWIQIIAASWLIYRLTNSAFLLGLLTFAGQLPTLLFTPFAGVMVDRWDRYKLIKTTQILFAFQSLIFGVLVLTEIIQIWHIIILNIFGGFVMAFDSPVRQSFVVDIVEDKKDIGNAVALNSMLFNMARMVGPAIAGILVAMIGEGWCFIINTITFLGIIVNLHLMDIKKTILKKSNNHVLTDLKEGFLYTYNFLPIRYILIILAFVSIVGMSMNVLMPIYTKDILLGDSKVLGFLMSSLGIGSLVGGVKLATKDSPKGLEKNIFWATIIFGLSLIILPIFHNFLYAMLIMLFIGFGMISQIISSNTMIQSLVDDDKRGRVMGIYSMSFMGTAPIGSLFAGTLSGLIGVMNTSIIAGTCCILAGLFFLSKIRIISKIAEDTYVKNVNL
ncbi:MAG TPA: MFS transporter [Bacteroidota bacterium]|nr:MFS transporter [Bacteroidota bacterium]